MVNASSSARALDASRPAAAAGGDLDQLVAIHGRSYVDHLRSPDELAEAQLRHAKPSPGEPHGPVACAYLARDPPALRRRRAAAALRGLSEAFAEQTSSPSASAATRPPRRRARRLHGGAGLRRVVRGVELRVEAPRLPALSRKDRGGALFRAGDLAAAQRCWRGALEILRDARADPDRLRPALHANLAEPSCGGATGPARRRRRRRRSRRTRATSRRACGAAAGGAATRAARWRREAPSTRRATTSRSDARSRRSSPPASAAPRTRPRGKRRRPGLPRPHADKEAKREEEEDDKEPEATAEEKVQRTFATLVEDALKTGTAEAMAVTEADLTEEDYATTATSGRSRVVVADGFTATANAGFASLRDAWLPAVGDGDELEVHDRTAPGDVVAVLDGAAVAVVNKVRITDAVLAALPDLGLVCVTATGVNNVDLDACARRGVLRGDGGELARALATADVVSLHVPLADNTARLVDGRFLAALKPGAILVNSAARVSTRRLLAALDEGRWRAYLDVLDDEPPSDPASTSARLAAHPRAVVTPHTAWATNEARQRLRDVACGNVRAFLAGEPLTTPAAS
ncbi:phosphoglycerate dehydrogenase [Aureococcus anophagefferens]|nr:phosphoglycerate dehydrogenase [Aureococcus anophagefferens]